MPLVPNSSSAEMVEVVDEENHTVEVVPRNVIRAPVLPAEEGLARKALGAFDKRVNSAGTVTAAGALLLASRYASRPEQGTLAAAFAPGADTDTLASMAGGLLGAINGGDWLGKLRESVQDDRYLIRLARTLISAPRPAARASSAHLDVRSFLQRLGETEIGTELLLADGRTGRLRNIVDHSTKTPQRSQDFRR